MEIQECGKIGNDIVKIDFILGMFIVFVPIDITLEIQGDTGVLAFAISMLAFALLIRRKVLLRRKNWKTGQEVGDNVSMFD